jgi:hypothetical protein
VAGAITLAFAAPAAAQGAVATPSAPLFFGAGIAFIPEDGATFKGFAVNVSKDIFTSGNLGIGPVGDFSFTTAGIDEIDVDVSVMTFAGGVRLTANIPDAKFTPFGQFLIGSTRHSTDTGSITVNQNALTFIFGGGVHVALNDKWNFLGELDFVNTHFDVGSGTDARIMLGVSTKIGG